MPTLVRLLTSLAILAGAILAAMVALVVLVEPRRSEIEVPVRLPTLERPSAPAVPAAPATITTPVGAEVRP